MWTVLLDLEFKEWLDKQDSGLVERFLAHVRLLEEFGPNLGRPVVDSLKGSKLKNLKELRVQYLGDPFRFIFIFDPLRQALILTGGNKKGNKRWYEKQIMVAEERYKKYMYLLGEV